MKLCPFCAEEIQDAAIVCRHCGRALDPEAVEQVESSLGQADAIEPSPEELDLGLDAIEAINNERGTEKGGAGVLLSIVVGLAVGAILTVLTYAGDLINLSELSEGVLAGKESIAAFRISFQELIFHASVTFAWVSGLASSITHGIRLYRNREREPLKRAGVSLFLFLVLGAVLVLALNFLLSKQLARSAASQEDRFVGSVVSFLNRAVVLGGSRERPVVEGANTEVPGDQATGTPASTPSPRVTPTVEGVAYLETFDPSRSRWPGGQTEDGWMFEVTDSGSYRVAGPSGSDAYYFNSAGWEVSDGYLSVEVWGDQDSSILTAHAVFFRIVDGDNFYVLILNYPSGLAYATKLQDGTWAIIDECIPESRLPPFFACFNEDAVIVPDNDLPTKVQIHLQGGTMRVSLDGQEAFRFYDGAFQMGDVGLGAISLTGQGATSATDKVFQVFFDNLEFRDSE